MNSKSFRPDSDASFLPTRWSLVVMAGETSVDKRREALRQLCEHYYEAIYAYIRRGLKKSPEDALDLTNGLIAKLLNKAPQIAFVPNAGKSGKPVKFRSFIYTCTNNHVWAEQKRQKKIQTVEDEDEFDKLAPRFLTTETESDPAFDKEFAICTMKKVLRKLETGPGAKEPEMFSWWVKYGSAKLPDGEFDKLVRRTGKTSGALRAQYLRLKNRWAAAAHQELIINVRDTLPSATPQAVMDEVNSIGQILARIGESVLMRS